MLKYVLKRFFLLIPVILGVTLLIFFVLDLSPGDPARLALGEMAPQESIDRWRVERGLNDPFFVRYFRYVGNMVKGDLGRSYFNNRDVFREVIQRFPITIELALGGMLIAILVGIPLGTISALKQYSFIDGLATVLGMLGIAMPSFWFGLMMIMFFSLRLGWLPSQGLSGFKGFIMPCFAVGISCAANIMRMTRSAMLEVVRTDFVRTAKAKGLTPREIVNKHEIRNVLIPVVTIAGLQFGSMMAGSVVIEAVFSLPGVGSFMISAIKGKDIPAVMGSITCFCIAFSFVNLLVDFVYGIIDPRIKA